MGKIMKTPLIVIIFLIVVGLCPPPAFTDESVPPDQSADVHVPILVYHRFGATVADSMTVTTEVFLSQLKIIQESGYTVIPLGQLVDFLLGQGPPPPPRSVVITVDDGHRSVYSDLFPLIEKYRIPATLFLYPSAISNASYAMTWEQAKEMQQSGLCDVQSHSYWHPNFKKDRKRMTPAEFEKSVAVQLTKSKARLEEKLGGKVDMLAWPFGIFDQELMEKAAAAGYRAAFSIERHLAGREDNIMAVPRFLILDSDRGEVFRRILTGNAPAAKIGY